MYASKRRFPNDPCSATASRNGTCYTEIECTARAGTGSGSCAQGFGVCCICELTNCAAGLLVE